MIETFRYRRIGSEFFSEISDAVLQRQTAVLIAPRYGGNRYAMYHLSRKLRDSGLSPIIYIRLFRQGPVLSEAALRKLISEAVSEVTGRPVESEEPPQPLLASVDRLQEELGKPIVLLVGNVDNIAYPLTRRLLEEVRVRDQDGRLTAVLGGEDNFSDLVHGPNSDFNCANRFVLQGLSESELSQFINRYCRALPIEFSYPEEAHHEIWVQTGGNRHLLRMLLWEILESHTRDVGNRETPFQVDDVSSFLQRVRLPGFYGTEVFHNATRLIDHEPRCWPDLQVLLMSQTMAFELNDREPGKLTLETGPPTLLELAGVAVREGRHLHFSSPLMQAFVERHYNPRHWGDLSIWNGQPERAFGFYEKSSLGPTRPSSADDRIDVELTLRSLSSAFYAAAPKGLNEVTMLFARCCRHILGFSDVAFWHFFNNRWQLDAARSTAEASSPVLAAESFLPASGISGPKMISVPQPWKNSVMAAVLPALRVDQQSAVVIGDPHERASISRQREQLTRELFDCFLASHALAVSMERNRYRLAVRDQHIEVINSIFDALGSRILDVSNALEEAASGLRKLGYSRVLFCLVNAQGDRIKGELDSSDDSRFDIAKATDWPLANPRADLQPYVISTCKPKIVEEARLEPLANRRVVSLACMKSFAIVPILNRGGKAVGTVHVERRDGVVPSEEEVEDLLQFGRQLAIAIEQSERVNLLQSALDKMPEPVLIVDRQRRLRFLNLPAGELLDLAPGWRDRGEAPPVTQDHLGKVAWELLGESLHYGQRLVRHVVGLGCRPAYRGAALSTIISDWKERPVGAMLHVEDLNYLYCLLEAIKLIAEASDTNSAMKGILQAVRLLGHRHGRLFLVPEGDPEALVCRFSLNPEGGVIEHPDGGAEIVLPRRSEPGFKTWRCIEERRAIVVCWKPDQENDGKVITPNGLEAINVKHPKCPNELDKKPGDYWIDIPLLARKQVLGKLSLSCDEDVKPEEFEYLKVMAQIAAELLDAFLRRERLIEEREEQVLGSAAEETLAFAAHNITTRLAALSILLERYRQREANFPALCEVNTDFSYALQELMRIIGRIKERLSGMNPLFERIDLVARVTRALKTLSPSAWTLECDSEVLEVDGDGDLLENALLELIQNSREIAEDQDLHVAVSLGIYDGKSGEWVKLDYSDNGPGVPQEFKNRIFDLFFTRRPGRGTSTGLGLAMVYRVIDAHAGVVWEDGAVGQGAHFTLTFPR